MTKNQLRGPVLVMLPKSISTGARSFVQLQPRALKTELRQITILKAENIEKLREKFLTSSTFIITIEQAHCQKKQLKFRRIPSVIFYCFKNIVSMKSKNIVILKHKCNDEFEKSVFFRIQRNFCIAKIFDIARIESMRPVQLEIDYVENLTEGLLLQKKTKQ